MVHKVSAASFNKVTGTVVSVMIVMAITGTRNLIMSASLFRQTGLKHGTDQETDRKTDRLNLTFVALQVV